MHDGTHGVREKQRYPTDKEGCQKPLGESPSLFTTERMYIWRDPPELEGNFKKNVSGDVKGMRGDCTMSQSIKRTRATKWIQGSVAFEEIHLGAMEERTGHLCQKAQGRARSNALENGTKSKWNEKETCGQPRSQGFPFEKGGSPAGNIAGNHRATIKEFVGERKKHDPKARGNTHEMHRKLNDSLNECTEEGGRWETKGTRVQ